MKISAIITSGILAISTLTLSPNPAAAAEAHVSGAACEVSDVFGDDGSYQLGSNYKFAVRNSADEIIGGWFTCPSMDIQGFEDDDFVSVNFHVWDGSTSQYEQVRACRTFAFSNGGHCGSWTSSSPSGTGNVTLSISDLGDLSYVDDFAYFDVNLTTAGLLKGYWMSTT